MSYTPDQLIRIATQYAQLSAKALRKLSQDSQNVDIEQPETFDEDYQKWLEMNRKPKKITEEDIDPDLVGLIDLSGADDLETTAAKKEKKKLDPKAKVRNRGTVCVPAESAKDKKDHFPINDEGQARNALARVHQYSSAPSWYSGSLKGLQDLVSRKVHSKYPSIGKADKKSKKSSLVAELLSFAEEVNDSDFLRANAQGAVTDQAQATNLTSSMLQSINAVNSRNNLTPEQVIDYVRGYLQTSYNYFQGNQISSEQYSQIIQAGQTKMHGDEKGPYAINWNQKAPQQQNTITVPTTTISSPAKPQGGGWTGPKIDPVFQTMLGVNPDGKLGKQTQAALDMYKKNRNPGMGNELAFEYLKREPEYKAKRALPWDDNSNTYGSTANQIVRENPF